MGTWQKNLCVCVCEDSAPYLALNRFNSINMSRNEVTIPVTQMHKIQEKEINRSLATDVEDLNKSIH